MNIVNEAKHCGEKSCKQLDFLPFDCEHCKGVFCLDHKDTHKCVFDRSQVNTIPLCPACKQYVMVRPEQSPDAIVNDHIASNCARHLLSTAEAERKDYIRKKKSCGVPSCRNENKAKYDTLICNVCKQQYCLTHRLGDDHDCAEVMRRGVKVNNSATALLAKLRGNREAASRLDQQRQARQAVRSGLTGSRAKAATLMYMGDEGIKHSDRFHLEVRYPKKYGAKRYKAQSMYFNQAWTIGRVIDNICRHLNVENRNNQAGALELYLSKEQRSEDEEAPTMRTEFPTDIPLELLQPSLKPGDTVRLAYR
eukprot:gb/GEZN01010666.1/.p1 GENE.gb/GEZN01010666.1/~~gb/GEZN01010666.1/.p1  ORF type:complete len:308 (-),score=24.14 gb/GEZN01010666.1/:271-1194(-)